MRKINALLTSLAMHSIFFLLFFSIKVFASEENPRSPTPTATTSPELNSSKAENLKSILEEIELNKSHMSKDLDACNKILIDYYNRLGLKDYHSIISPRKTPSPLSQNDINNSNLLMHQWLHNRSPNKGGQE